MENRLPATIRRMRRPPGSEGKRGVHNKMYNLDHVAHLIRSGDHGQARRGLLLRGMPAEHADKFIKHATATATAPRRPAAAGRGRH